MTNNITPGMWNWPLASQTGHPFGNLWPWCLMLPRAWGSGYCVHRQLPSGSCHSADLSWSHLPCVRFFLSQLHPLWTPSPAFIFCISLFLDPSHWVTNMLLGTSSRISSFLSCALPIKLPSLPSSPTSWRNLLSVPRSHFLPAPPGLTASSFITTGQPLSLSPREASVRTCIWCQVPSGSSLVLQFPWSVFSPRFHSVPYSFPWVRIFVFTSCLSLAEGLHSSPDPVVTSM